MIERHDTAAERDERSAREDGMKPRRALPKKPPAELKGHRVASATWRRLIAMYNELEAEIVNRLDLGHIIDFCILVEQLEQMDHMRGVAYRAWLALAKEHERLAQAEADAERQGSGDQVDVLHDETVAMAIKVVGAFDAVQKLDTRADRKRDLIKRWRESMYLTPRSKVAAQPKRKEPEEPQDPMDVLLGNVTEFVNGNGG